MQIVELDKMKTEKETGQLSDMLADVKKAIKFLLKYTRQTRTWW